jgi:hypothetical protein
MCLSHFSYANDKFAGWVNPALAGNQTASSGFASLYTTYHYAVSELVEK